jgi:hypothetical protein
MSQSNRDALQDGVALLGTALASLSAGGILPATMATVAAGGGALAIVAMLEKSWRNNRETIIEEIEDFVEDKIGLDIELDEVVDEIVVKGLEVATDILEDGDLDKPLSEVADELIDSLKDLSVKELKSQLKEKGLSIDGKKAELIKRLLNV